MQPYAAVDEGAAELVSVEICPAIVEFLTRQQTKGILEQIADKTGIRWFEASRTFMMSGSLKQVQMSRGYLLQAIVQCGGIADDNKMKSTLSKLQNLRNEEADRNDSERAKDVSPSEFPRKLPEKLQLLLKETQQEKSDLQKQLSQQQKSRSELEERLKTEQVSSQSLQLQLEANELSIRELRLEVEEGRRKKTALEETVRRLQLQIAEEMDRHATIERDLQLALSTTQAELSELRSNRRDWIILREEVTLGRKVLGNGAWGTVREGTFRGSKVAVKEIHELILSDHNRRLFEREMNIASRCRHPNLLQFIGATNNDGSPLFVTELLDSCLRRLLSERELTPKEVLNLALDVAKGLNYLHLNKPLPIIHRDISSANVLLWRRDDCWRAKLSDYGAANFMQKCMTANPGAMIYSAPEAFTPKQSPKVDVYSYGVLLCEMCIRELPDPRGLLNQIKRVSHNTFRQLIQRCVERKPGKRPTIAEVIPELELC